MDMNEGTHCEYAYPIGPKVLAIEHMQGLCALTSSCLHAETHWSTIKLCHILSVMWAPKVLSACTTVDLTWPVDLSIFR